jgi:hypothetical protein
MPNAVEIRMTRRGFEVRMGVSTTAFADMGSAITFAQQRLEHAWQLRDLKERCE